MICLTLALVPYSIVEAETETNISRKNLSQGCSMDIVNSFIEHNLYGDANPLVPTLNKWSEVRTYILYNCINNVLLVSNKVQYVSHDGDGGILKSAALLIWLTINHQVQQVLP